MADSAVRVDSSGAYIDLVTRESIRALSADFNIRGISIVSAVLDFSSLVNGAAETLTMTVAGARDGDIVSVGAPAALNVGMRISARVTADDTVSLSMINLSGITVDPDSGTYTVMVSHLN